MQKKIENILQNGVIVLTLMVVCLLMVLVGTKIGAGNQNERPKPDLSGELADCKLELEQSSQKVFKAELQLINNQSIHYQSASNEALYGWLSKHDTMNSKAEYIVKTAQKYEVDPVYIIALISLETGHMDKGSALTHNNVSGIKCGEDYCAYPTYEESILDTVRYTSEYASTLFDEPLTTVEAISQKWSTDPSKADKIVQIMREVQQFK